MGWAGPVRRLVEREAKARARDLDRGGQVRSHWEAESMGGRPGGQDEALTGSGAPGQLEVSQLGWRDVRGPKPSWRAVGRGQAPIRAGD